MLTIQAEKNAASDAEQEGLIAAVYKKMHQDQEKFFSDLKQTRNSRRKRDLEETLEQFLTEVTKKQATAETGGKWWDCAEEYLLSMRQSASGTNRNWSLSIRTCSAVCRLLTPIFTKL
jgi:hypothetical protein